MNRIKRSWVVTVMLLLAACSATSDEENVVSDDSIRVQESPQLTGPACPEGNHQDSLIPCIWGMPTEESFQRADSGLVWLGGCEIPSDKMPKWHCKKHLIQF